MMMHPAYTWTDSNPHHTHPKSNEMNPNHINLNPLYQPWSYSSNYPHPFPHNCCNHTYYGNGPYGFQPHYPPPPPPPPPSFHPHGYYYPPFPGAYPSYSVPPQHYSVDLPRYDYDKNNQINHHCCECHHRKDEKIKEEPQIESQNDGKKSDSVSPQHYSVPLLLKDRPDYPVMWVPRGYMSNNTDLKAKEMEKYSHNPVLIKHHEPSKKGINGEIVQDENGGDGDRFPFQIFWLPSKNDEVGKNTDLVTNKESSDQKMIKKIECSDTESECKTNNIKHSVQKVIPVKQVAANDVKKNTKVAVNPDSMEKTDNGNKSSPKTSKLPPVCLRIEPLSKKKKTSRSPSPTEKQRSNGSQINSPKSSQQQPQPQVVNKIQNEQIEDNKIKTVDHADKVERDNIADHGGSEKEKLVEKKNMTEDEAALIIQSVYRGFEVRKSHPLKKLRQIYEVRKQVTELRNRIQDLESVGVVGKKEVIIIGETIMSLLLKLDTIQGLHPFVREVRKSVAKELVGLQEKLDSLACVKSESPIAFGPQQVPEDDVILENSDQAQAQMDLLENHEQKATESQNDDDTKSSNLEKQLESNNSDEEIQHKLKTDSEDDVMQKNPDQAQFQAQLPAQLDSLENHEQRTTESQCDDTKVQNLDQQLQKSNEDEVIQDKLKTDSEDDVIQENSDQDQAQAQLPTQLDLLENHEDKATESHDDDDAEAANLEKQLEKSNADEAVKAKFQTDSGTVIGNNHDVESSMSQVELHKEKMNDVPTEIDESMMSCEMKAQEVIGDASTESGEAKGYDTTIVEPEVEFDKKKFDESASERDSTNEVEGAVTENGGIDMVHMELEQKSDVDNSSIKKEDESGNNVEKVGMDSELRKEDAKENAMEEIIRELRGRVKELEKKLSKNKKIKVSRKKKSRGCVVQKNMVTKA